MDNQAKLAVVIHADVVGSTRLFHADEVVAHKRIRDAFHRFSAFIERYGGRPHELRGDALVAEFARASDAIYASLAFQAENVAINARLEGDIRPQIRIGVALAEVVSGEGVLTGTGVILAQRLEQAAPPDGVVAQATVFEAIRGRTPLEHHPLDQTEFKGFETEVRAYRIGLAPGRELPAPQPFGGARASGVLARAVRKTLGSSVVSKLVRAAVVAVVVLAAGALWLRWDWFQPRSVGASDNSLAVLPFVNDSGAQSEEYLSNGLTDTLIGRLSQLRGLRVAARTSSFSFKGTSADIRTIGERLGVSLILEGSVQRQGGQLRVNARLVRTEDGSQVWARTFDRAVADIFAIQDEIASAVGEALKLASFAASMPRTTEHAYDNYLRGREHLRKRTVGEIRLAIRLFEHAVREDPAFALAYSGLADAYLFLNEYSSAAQTEVDANLQLAEKAIRNALLIDNELAEAHASLGLRLVQDAEEGAEAAFRRALEFNPNYVPAQLWYGDLLNREGRLVEAVAQFEAVQERDPLSYISHYKLGEVHRRLGNYRVAVDYYREALGLEPAFPLAYLRLGWTQWQMGDIAQAAQHYERGIEIEPTDAGALCELALIRLDLDDYPGALRALNQADRVDETHPLLVQARSIYDISQGRYESARAYIDAHLERYPGSRAAMRMQGAVALILGDPDAAIESYELAGSLRMSLDVESLFSEPATLTFSIVHSVIQAKVYYLLQRDRLGDRLLGEVEATLEHLARTEYHVPGLSYFRGAILALRGDAVGAERELAQAIDEGWRRGWELRHNPVFDELRATEANERLLADMRARP